MIKQRSDEWFAERMGKFTASEIHRLMGAKGLGKTGETYVLEKVAESLGAKIPVVQSKAMEHGVLTEPFAKLHYERAMGVEIEDCGFIVPEWSADAGCSPDGKIAGQDCYIEVKCPYNPDAHVRYLLLKEQDELKENKPEYYWQIMMSIAICNAIYWDFVSYHEDFQGELKMAVLRIQPNIGDIELLKSRIAEAVAMKNRYLKQIMG